MTKAQLIAALQPFDDDAPVSIEIETLPKFDTDGNPNPIAQGVIGDVSAIMDESYAVNKGAHCTLLIYEPKFIE